MTIRELWNAVLDLPYGGNLMIMFVVLAVVLPIIGSVIRYLVMRRYN